MTGARALLCLLLAVHAAPKAEVRMRSLEAMVPMRDKVHLSTNIFLPESGSRFPVLLVRTPYGKGRDLIPGYHVFLENRFAVVVQNVRGRYGSEGFFQPPEQELKDGYDTLHWIAAQAWSNGKIGMLGGSYLGIAQWKAALSGNPHLKAIFPVVAGSDDYLDRFYSTGGAFKLGHRLTWVAENMRPPGTVRPPFDLYTRRLPLRQGDTVATGRRVDFYQRALDHPSYDAYWRDLSVREKLDRIQIPAFLVGGWYDNFVESDLDTFARLSRRSNLHRLVVGPWPHNMSVPFPGVSFGPQASAPVRRYQVEWFRRWLMNAAGPVNDPPVRIFVMGANKWRDEQEWPLSRTQSQAWYLQSAGNANSLSGDGSLTRRPRSREVLDEFTYNPRTPVPTMGGAVCCNPRLFPWGPMDQRPVERRMDVLVFTSPAVKEDLEVTGTIRAVLYVSTSQPDTDFTAKLVDVFPDGEARNLTDGILRLRYRESLERPLPAKPGDIYEITIPMGVTSNVFRAGHRIRVEISSSNFPRFDRNLNTGRRQADETELRIAQQVVYSGRKHPSHLLLPVIPEQEDRDARRAALHKAAEVGKR